jgi:ribose 5-phosphate isomerase A
VDPKQRAGQAALAYLRDGMTVGLGTGSTAKFFIDALAAALRQGQLKGIRCIPTSVHSEEQARNLGIPLTHFGESPAIDVTVDGADEVGPGLNLIKGLGGALLREKIVAQYSRRLVIIADESKKVIYLGRRCPLPVEVTQFAHEASERFLRSLGSVPALRMGENDAPFVTDNGNFIYDCRFPRIEDPRSLQEKLAHQAGIVETGLFLDMADVILLAGIDSMETLKR